LREKLFFLFIKELHCYPLLQTGYRDARFRNRQEGLFRPLRTFLGRSYLIRVTRKTCETVGRDQEGNHGCVSHHDVCNTQVCEGVEAMKYPQTYFSSVGKYNLFLDMRPFNCVVCSHKSFKGVRCRGGIQSSVCEDARHFKPCNTMKSIDNRNRERQRQ